MRHIYKTVSLEEYLRANKDLTIGAFTGAISGQLALALKASKAIESLINHYAKDGWEYVRSEEFHTGFLGHHPRNCSMHLKLAQQENLRPIHYCRCSFLNKNIQKNYKEKCRLTLMLRLRKL